MSSKSEHLGWLVKRLQHGNHRALDKQLATLDVSLIQWNALREIERNPGCSQRQLAALTFNSDQAFGTLLTRLWAAGLIERSAGPGRASHHQLTPKGQALLHGGQKIMFEVTDESFSALTKAEQNELVRLLTKVLDARAAG